MKRLSCYMFYCLSSEEDIPRVWEIIITAHNKKEAGQIFQEYGKLKHNGRLVLIDITRIRKIIKYLDEKFGSANYEIIDSFFKNASHDAKPLWLLGKSLQLLSTADFAVFAPFWKSARGCCIEHDCAIQYGIKIIYIEKL